MSKYCINSNSEQLLKLYVSALLKLLEAQSSKIRKCIEAGEQNIIEQNIIELLSTLLSQFHELFNKAEELLDDSRYFTRTEVKDLGDYLTEPFMKRYNYCISCLKLKLTFKMYEIKEFKEFLIRQVQAGEVSGSGIGWSFEPDTWKGIVRFIQDLETYDNASLEEILRVTIAFQDWVYKSIDYQNYQDMIELLRKYYKFAKEMLSDRGFQSNSELHVEYQMAEIEKIKEFLIMQIQEGEVFGSGIEWSFEPDTWKRIVEFIQELETCDNASLEDILRVTITFHDWIHGRDDQKDIECYQKEKDCQDYQDMFDLFNKVKL